MPSSTNTSPGRKTSANSLPRHMTVTSAGNVSPTLAHVRLSPHVICSSEFVNGGRCRKWSSISFWYVFEELDGLFPLSRFHDTHRATDFFGRGILQRKLYNL